jgi:hypothetical protein
MGIIPEQTTRTIQYRYPGTKFFESDQRSIFFGREQETHDLIDSIKAYDVFVIFADSGIGKTSLLNAALIPEMEKENMKPIKFRFQDTSKPPVQTIFEKLAPVSPIPDKLWRLFKCCQFNNQLPVFVFDQFEEFFNHPKPQREACIREIAELASEYLPDYIREEMREKFREKDPTPEELKYYLPARLKLLFLIRADKLKLMDDLSAKIPLILRNRFHLKPLRVKQAEQAIVLPALLPQNRFASPSFNFQEEAIADICSYLKNEEGEVESFQLQILCQELEKRIIHRHDKKEKSLWITREELGGEAGMDRITKNYYNNQFLSIQEEGMREKAIELIEDKLIVEDRRISLPEEFLTREGYSKELLDYLLNTTRLIRAYNERNSRYFEISHDRLLPSILQSKEQRREEENKLTQLRELQRLKDEQEAKNRELQKQREEEKKSLELKILIDKAKNEARLRKFVDILAILLIVSLLSSLLATKNAMKANIASINYLLEKQDYGRADSILEAGRFFNLLYFPARDTLNNLAEFIDTSSIKQKSYNSYLQAGDTLAKTVDAQLDLAAALINRADSLASTQPVSAFANDTINREKLLQALGGPTLLNAYQWYLKAQETDFNPINPDEMVPSKLRSMDQLISLSFEQCIYAIQLFLLANDLQKAQAALGKAKYLDSLAFSNNIYLKEEARNSLDSLQKVLKQ